MLHYYLPDYAGVGYLQPSPPLAPSLGFIVNANVILARTIAKVKPCARVSAARPPTLLTKLRPVGARDF